MYGNKLVIAIVCLGVGVSIALACTPQLPWQLLSDRAGTMKATPKNSFTFEAMHLAPPPRDKLRAFEPDENNPCGSGLTLIAADPARLSNQQVELVESIRQQKSGDIAFQQGAALPPSVRLYTAGAVDFHHGEFATASQRFDAVLKLRAGDQLLRATWAAYMLGRIYARAGEIDKSSKAFQLTRALALAGAPDPLGLAVASYGEEARLHFALASIYLTKPGGKLPAELRYEYGQEIAAAVRLYAEQAARGSYCGAESLRWVAAQLFRGDQESNLLQASISDAAVQRLVVAYALADSEDAPTNGKRRQATISAGQYDETTGELERYNPSPITVSGLVGLIKAGPGLKHVEGADRLAALAYRAGDYDDARQLADQTPGPLASWVNAKLALQQGDLKRAAGFYAEAVKAFPLADRGQVLDKDNLKLLTGETGVLALARGEYVEALAILKQDDDWADSAYVAERVLTTDELKHFVDARVRPPRPIQPVGDEPDSSLVFRAGPDAQLRDLLARRLVRDKRYAEAIAYFEDRSTGEQVTEYAHALYEATRNWWRINRARGWYGAAVLARERGMEMMGTEFAPDYYSEDGNDWESPITPGPPELTSDGERSRFAASTPNPDKRFHYRYVAVAEAQHAADLLPPRSQAFAAVLCKATGWMLSSDNDAAVRQLYHRYVKEGPYVRWAVHFGHSCPEPDFGEAARLPRVLLVRDARHFVGRYRWEFGLALYSYDCGRSGSICRATTPACSELSSSLYWAGFISARRSSASSRTAATLPNEKRVTTVRSVISLPNCKRICATPR
jgi:cellulose synthase operon protein C